MKRRQSRPPPRKRASAMPVAVACVPEVGTVKSIRALQVARRRPSGALRGAVNCDQTGALALQRGQTSVDAVRDAVPIQRSVPVRGAGR